MARLAAKKKPGEKKPCDKRLDGAGELGYEREVQTSTTPFLTSTFTIAPVTTPKPATLPVTTTLYATTLLPVFPTTTTVSTTTERETTTDVYGNGEDGEPG